jgi:hypothetical protein
VWLLQVHRATINSLYASAKYHPDRVQEGGEKSPFLQGLSEMICYVKRQKEEKASPRRGGLFSLLFNNHAPKQCERMVYSVTLNLTFVLLESLGTSTPNRQVLGARVAPSPTVTE